MSFWDTDDVPNKDLEDYYGSKIRSTIKSRCGDIIEIRKWLYAYIIEGMGCLQKKFLDYAFNTIGKDGFYVTFKVDGDIELIDPSTIDVPVIIKRGTSTSLSDAIKLREGEVNYIDLSLGCYGSLYRNFQDVYDDYIVGCFDIGAIGSKLSVFGQTEYDAMIDFQSAIPKINSSETSIATDSSFINIFIDDDSDFDYSGVYFIGTYNYMNSNGLLDILKDFSSNNKNSGFGSMITYDMKGFEDDLTYNFLGAYRGQIHGGDILGLTDLGIEIEFEDSLELLYTYNLVDYDLSSISNDIRDKFSIEYIIDYGTPSEQRIKKDIPIMTNGEGNHNDVGCMIVPIVHGGTHRVIVKLLVSDRKELVVASGDFRDISMALCGMFTYINGGG